jgi:predicted Fe-Mo cluster-binding NifX family protein
MIHYEKCSTFSVVRTQQQNSGQNRNINMPNKPLEKGEKLKYLDMTQSKGSSRDEGIRVQLA